MKCEVPFPMSMHVPVLSFSSIARAVELRETVDPMQVLEHLTLADGHLSIDGEYEEQLYRDQRATMGSSIAID